MQATLAKRLLGEGLGTMGLELVIIGAGVMAERMGGGNVGVAMLGTTLAITGGLYALIEVFGPISGAHFNPVVSLVMASRRVLPWREFGPYVLAQCVGAVLGAWLVHAMFDLPLLEVSTKLRPGWGPLIGEVVATSGLLLAILCAPPPRGPAIVATYVGAACWFTASTCFANPAITLGRVFSDTFTGIAPANAPGFVVAELVGAGLAVLLYRALTGSARN
ncbi:MAG: aquaporin family protein [Pelomonas sp.]|nr:aquaporin family protein [Roseateles sp.]